MCHNASQDDKVTQKSGVIATNFSMLSQACSSILVGAHGGLSIVEKIDSKSS